MADDKAKSWYETGYTGIKRETDRIEQMSGPNRIWIPAAAKKELVFIDDEPACIHEHNPKMNGEWKNWFTCLKPVYPDDIACCEILGKNYPAYYVGFYTVIDCSEWTDKKGNKYQYEVKLFPAKLKTLKRFQLRRQEKGPFAGKLFSVMRVDKESPSCGDEFEVVREVDMAKLFTLANYKGKKIAEWFSKGVDEETIKGLQNIWKCEVVEGKLVPKLVPFNYFKLLHPLPPKDMRAVLNGSQIEKREDDFGGGGGGSAPSGGKGSADESVPF
jgi:hypothetical protein